MAALRTPQGHTLLLPDGAVSIGADPANEVPVAAHLGLAPVHFRLQPWEGGHFIEDAGSGLGTLVNGHAINWKPLDHGDLIVAGELEVIYSESSPSDGGEFSAIAVPAGPAALPPPLQSLSSYGIATATLLPPEASGLQVLRPTPPLVRQPPAWLPEDLLPENYHRPAAITEGPPAGDPTAPPGDGPLLEQPRPPDSTLNRPRLRRLLPLATILAVLGWAGHMAWQSGNLDGLFQSLQSAWSKISGQAPAGIPAPASVTHPSGVHIPPPQRPFTP